MPHIALLTDFGLDDPYVGQVKAVLAARLPNVRCLDISHGVRPHNLLQGGFFLAASRHFFPTGTLFMAVIDPGVGTERAIVLLEKHGQLFLAPDNGLLTSILMEHGPARAWLIEPTAVPDEPSATFHGRDVFAPLAARLAGGEDPLRLGSPCPPERLARLDRAVPRMEGKRLVCSVLHVDRFGNVVLNLALIPWRDLLFGNSSLSLAGPVSRQVIPARTYALIPGLALGLVPGSQGHLELAMNRCSAAAAVGLDIGSELVLRADDIP